MGCRGSGRSLHWREGHLLKSCKRWKEQIGKLWGDIAGIMKIPGSKAKNMAIVEVFRREELTGGADGLLRRARRLGGGQIDLRDEAISECTQSAVFSLLRLRLFRGCGHLVVKGLPAGD